MTTTGTGPGLDDGLVDGPVLVVDFGAQYAQLIARRVREAHVYSEIVPHTATAEDLLAHRPQGIILSGGPKSVNETPAPTIDPAIYESGVPILGICYGAQLLTQQLGGEVARTGRGEYGRTTMTLTERSPLFVDWPGEAEVWMSHADGIAVVPDGFVPTAHSADAPVAALHDAGSPHLRRAIPSRGGPHRTGPGSPGALPLRRLRLPALVDPHVDHRGPGGGGAGSGG